MPLVVYFDEVGNPTLDASDKDFPVFAIVMFICDLEHYISEVIPRVSRLKFKWFRHEGVVLHSRDIRKAQGDFGFLTDPVDKSAFIEDINTIMSGCDYQLLAVAIRKDKLVNQYVDPADPYDLAFLFAMERLVSVLERVHQTDVTIIAEKRGKKEDRKLHAEFQRIVTRGTDYIELQRFKGINWKLEFIPKSKNLLGTQMADLAAYPIARRVLDETKPNPSYEIEIVRLKLCLKLKIFP